MTVGHGGIGEAGDEDRGRLRGGIPLGADRQANRADRRGAALLEKPEYLVITPVKQERKLFQRR